MTNHRATKKLIYAITEQDHTMGLESASVTLLEYGDYECPRCHDAYFIVKKLQKWFGNHLRFCFRHFPLTSVHPHATSAAQAAEAAAAQGWFWEMHDHLYEHQQLLDTNHLTRYAAKLGLDTQRFNREMANGAHVGRVHRDIQSGVANGVTETPTFFINSARYTDSWDFDDLLSVIEETGQF